MYASDFANNNNNDIILYDDYCCVYGDFITVIMIFNVRRIIFIPF